MSADYVSIGMLNGDGEYLYRIVGTSRSQEILSEIVGGKTEECAHFACHAILLPEPKNPHDRYAIAVSVNGILVGYVSSHDNIDILNALATANLQAGQCPAKIVGGWLREDGDEGSFGVRLDARMPFVFTDRKVVHLESHVASLISRLIPHFG